MKGKSDKIIFFSFLNIPYYDLSHSLSLKCVASMIFIEKL